MTQAAESRPGRSTPQLWPRIAPRLLPQETQQKSPESKTMKEPGPRGLVRALRRRPRRKDRLP
ncbi:hypothetical protein GCM10010277_87940 [Streptomyces longisporoflavus]|nr:hypothetical protein GCM10010277_87940 [Streptomyces longisporoflavus]